MKFKQITRKRRVAKKIAKRTPPSSTTARAGLVYNDILYYTILNYTKLNHAILQ